MGYCVGRWVHEDGQILQRVAENGREISQAGLVCGVYIVCVCECVCVCVPTESLVS